VTNLRREGRSLNSKTEAHSELQGQGGRRVKTGKAEGTVKNIAGKKFSTGIIIVFGELALRATEGRSFGE